MGLLVALFLPPLELAGGLPSHKACVEALALNDRAGLHVAAGMEREDLDETGRENMAAVRWHLYERWAEWSAALRATDPKAHPLARRLALRELVSLVGWRAVITGQLQPPVPLEAIPTR